MLRICSRYANFRRPNEYLIKSLNFAKQKSVKFPFFKSAATFQNFVFVYQDFSLVICENFGVKTTHVLAISFELHSSVPVYRFFILSLIVRESFDTFNITVYLRL